MWKWILRHSQWTRNNRGGGGDINVPETPPVPGPGPGEQELQNLQLQFFREQAPLQLQAQQQQLGLLGSLGQQAEQFAGFRADVLEPLLRGEAAPGMFGQLGTPFEEGPAFERGRERILSSLAEAGLLDSGIRAELETQLSGQIATESESARRGELSNLLSAALGGAGQIVGEPIALGGQPIQTGIGAGAGALGGQQTTAQRVSGFNQAIFQAQLEASAQERAARSAMFGDLFKGIGGIAGGAATGGFAKGGAFGSSITLKENVQDIDSALEKVEKLRGVLFDWKASKDKDGGVIAEEVEQIIPEAVTEIKGVKCIKPMMIVAYLIEAIKELRNGRT